MADGLRKLDGEYFDRSLTANAVKSHDRLRYYLASWLFDTGFGAATFIDRMKSLIDVFGEKVADEVMVNVWHRNHDT
jgi:hypothetical protein